MLDYCSYRAAQCISGYNVGLRITGFYVVYLTFFFFIEPQATKCHRQSKKQIRPCFTLKGEDRICCTPITKPECQDRSGLAWLPFVIKIQIEGKKLKEGGYFIGCWFPFVTVLVHFCTRDSPWFAVSSASTLHFHFTYS